MRSLLLCLAVLLLSSPWPLLAAQTPAQYVDLDACDLENHQRIEDCLIAYRWYGDAPRADFSNVIVLPSWYSGTVNAWPAFIGKGRMINLPGYALLAIDAFGNGASSSPSNSLLQPDAAFPEFTIGDIVRAQHRLLTEVLGIQHVRGIVSVSMGGMQALQWAVLYPDFADDIAALAATPKPTTEDIAPWRSHVEYVDKYHVRGSALDRRYQLVAMMRHDIAGGLPMIEAARAIQARTFLMFDRYDRLLRPDPVVELAGLLQGDLLGIATPCGHFSAAVCAAGRVGEAVRDFYGPVEAHR